MFNLAVFLFGAVIGTLLATLVLSGVMAAKAAKYERTEATLEQVKAALLYLREVVPYGQGRRALNSLIDLTHGG